MNGERPVLPGYSRNRLWGAYVISAMDSFYCKVFVHGGVAVSEKYPRYMRLHQKGPSPPFVVAQSMVLIAFIILTALAVRKFLAAVSATAGTPLTPGSTLA